MPHDNDFKRLVRARMEKTGEAYTAARAQLIATPKPVAAVAPPPVNYARLAGMRNATITEKTGRDWEHWVYALDRRGASKLTHTEIVAIVQQEYKIPDWWAQTVTVGSERINGLRAIGQRRNGTCEMSKSKTFGVPVTELFEAWANART